MTAPSCSSPGQPSSCSSYSCLLHNAITQYSPHRFSGVIAFNFYAVTIFSAVFTDLSPHLGAVISAVTQLAASLVSGVLSDCVGRRPLLVSSGLVMTLALAGFGTYSLYHDPDTAAGHGAADTVPLVLVLLFECRCSHIMQRRCYLLM